MVTRGGMGRPCATKMAVNGGFHGPVNRPYTCIFLGYRLWHIEAKRRPWPTIKLKEDYVSCLFKNHTTFNRATWRSQLSTHKLKWLLFFISDHGYCFFCLLPPSS